MDSLPFRLKDLGMRALHKANYNVEVASNEFKEMQKHEPKNEDVRCTRETLYRFHSLMIEKRKDFNCIASDLGVSLGACLTYYYNKYKQSDEYQELKMCLKEESDQCHICHKHGDLICCDGCNHTFHLTCIKPPILIIPAGDWYCPSCKQSGTPQRKLCFYGRK